MTLHLIQSHTCTIGSKGKEHQVSAMEMKPKKVRVSLTLDEDLIKEMRDLADKNDRSLSQLINRCLRYYSAIAKKNPEKYPID